MSWKRTESFFDQDNSSKKNPGFYRKQKSETESSSAPKSSNTKAPLPVSASTKEKLSQFAFKKPATPSKSHHASENHTTDGPITARISQDQQNLPTPSKSNQRDSTDSDIHHQPKPPREPPTTPAPRVPLYQLMSVDEELFAVNSSQANVTPEDRLYWQSGTPAEGASKAASRAGKKRVAAYSPPPTDSPAGKRQETSFDLQNLGNTLKTPLIDPATQLWKKYSAGGDPAARLFDAALNRSPSGFRRALVVPEGHSQNRLKRRKTTAFEEIADSDVLGGETSSSSIPLDGVSRKKRVNRLMNQLKNVGKSETKPPIPELSSPLAKSRWRDMPSSPVHARPEENKVATELDKTEEVGKFISSESEDYGDFDDNDVDMDFFEQVDKAVERSQSGPSNSRPAHAGANMPSSPPNRFDDDDGDMFDDDGDDSFYSTAFDALMSPFDIPSKINQAGPRGATNAKNGSSVVLERNRRIQRYKITAISDGKYQVGNGRTQPQKIITLQHESVTAMRQVILRDSWVQSTTVYVGQIVHVIGSFDKHNSCTIDNKHNYIILDPDFLVSATTVADTVDCLRKAVLQERVKVTGETSKPMVYGNILHALFQSAIEAGDFQTPSLLKKLDSILINNIQSLFVLREDIPTAREYVKTKLPQIQDWASRFITNRPNKRAIVTDGSQSSSVVAISKLLDIEEHVWSPLYGLKGNIDATVQATLVEGSKQKIFTVPLELKTGRNASSIPHRAQTMLYTLLLSDRYDIAVTSGLLYYMETGDTIRVSAVRHELRELIIKRNQVSGYITKRDILPDMLRSSHSCGRCYAKNSCFLYHSMLEGGTAETSGAEKTFLEVTKHLTVKHKYFFKHWDTLLTKEEKDSVRFRRELWTMTSSNREAVGRCFGGLIIIPESISISQNNTKINKYSYSFKRKFTNITSTFFDSQINEGEPIVVSDENEHYALAIGYVTKIQQNQITVEVDRRLHNARTRQTGFEENERQIFNGILEIGRNSNSESQLTSQAEVLYRVDKDEFSNGMANIRNNLIQLMSSDTNDTHRRVIVDLEAPRFKPSSTAYELCSQSGLNGDQKDAISKVMSAQDYALVLGMPGTGKTTTIAHIIRALVSQGKSVLLASYTHTAVDNILLKLGKENFGIFRLGTQAKIHPEVRKFAQLAETPRNTFEEIRKAFNGPKVVATTCLGINHPVFAERLFDYCIIDEASQITLPVCIGPIRFAKTFILVGDHYQLPPLVKTTEAREGGLDISMFKMLSEAHPEAVVNLEHQYRMCEEIMTLSNELIYSGRLKCGSTEVAKRSLLLPDKTGLRDLHTDPNQCTSSCWLADLMSEHVKACFVDTDPVPAPEVKKGDRIHNPTEAAMVHQMVEGLLSCGVDPSSIGVICVYRSQLKVIQHLLKARPAIEMHTADRFQGRDKEVVIISLVRSNEQKNIGDLLQDWRRINVAFTRARTKLIVLGSKSTLCSNELLRDFVAMMEKRSWVYPIPKNAHLIHQVPQGQAPSNRGNTDSSSLNKSPKRINGRPGGLVVMNKSILGGRPILRDIANSFI